MPGAIMKPSWFSRSKIHVEVLGGKIVVTMRGTDFSIVYEKVEDNHLIASTFSARKPQNETCKVSSSRE